MSSVLNWNWVILWEQERTSVCRPYCHLFKCEKSWAETHVENTETTELNSREDSLKDRQWGEERCAPGGDTERISTPELDAIVEKVRSRHRETTAKWR